MAIKMMRSLEDINFHILQGEPFILMIGSTTCMPCKRFTPIVEEVSEIFTRFTFAKVNIDELPEVNSLVYVGSVPTLIFWKRSKEVRREIGLVPSETLKKIVYSVFNQ